MSRRYQRHDVFIWDTQDKSGAAPVHAKVSVVATSDEVRRLAQKVTGRRVVSEPSYHEDQLVGPDGYEHYWFVDVE